MGHPVKANKILYAGKQRERKHVWGKREFLKWLRLAILASTIGNGYHLFRSLWWVAGFTSIGALLFAWVYQGNSFNCDIPTLQSVIFQTSGCDRLLAFLKFVPEAFAFSLDLLLPIVKLNECHYKILPTLPYGARYYFYVHELIGYFLGVFVVAGLSGITKK